MAQQLQKKFLGNDQVDGDKIKLEQGQTIRAVDSTSTVVDLIKLDNSDKVIINGEEAALKSQVDAEQSAREAADSALDARLDIIEGANTVPGSIAKAQKDAQDYADMKVAALVDSAPALLDTLNELAAALGDDPNFVTTVTNLVADVQSNLTQEIADRIADVNAEESRAIGIESGLQDQIDQEILDRAADVDAEQSRAEAAEAALDLAKVDRAGDTMTGTLFVPNLYAANPSADIGYDGGEFSSVHAKSLRNTDSADLSIISTTSNVNIVSGNDFNRDGSPGTVAKDIILNATSGQIDATGSVIKNVANAASSDHAVNKGQLDSVESSLQSQIDALSGGSGASISALQAELDATQTGAGLEVDGSYVSPAFSNYMGAASSLKDADIKLDTAIKAVQDELDFSQSSIGLDPNGSFTISGNYFIGGASVKGSLIELDTALNNVSNSLIQETQDRQDADSAIQSELDQTQQGAGLNANGTYTAPALSNYISGALSLSGADFMLDAAIKTTADALAQEIVDRGNADTDLQNNIDNLDGYAQTIRADLDQEVIDRAAADSALDVRVTELESVVWFKEKFSISNGQTFVTLSHTPIAHSMSAFVDRLAIHEGASEDYTISGTTMTFLNDLVFPGQSELGAGDTVYVKYQYKV